MQTPSSQLQVSVGFADSSSPSANFPEPWNEANANLNFVGAGKVYRAGAVRLDNPGGTAMTVDSVTVDLGRPGPVFQLWTNITVPANGSAILTQTADGNFNTSASPLVGCGQPLAANETRIPKVTVTIGGAGTDSLDTAHVLDTGGFDSSCRGNQSLEWRPIGTVGLNNPAGSVQLSGESAPHDLGTQNTFNVLVNDASNQPLANAPVMLKVINGPNSGRIFPATTDATGSASVQYSSASQGTDLLQALIANLSGGVLQSQQLSTAWTSAAACASPAAQNPAATQLIYVGQTTGTFGNAIRLAALLTDGAGNPLSGRTIPITFAGQTVTVTTDANGTAATTASSLPTGPTAVTISFAGDQNFQPAQLSATVTIQPAATLLRYTGSSLFTSLGRQAVTALLTDAQGRTPLANRRVNFTFNGTTVSGTTGSNGVVTAAFNFQTAQTTGLSQLQISFAGDANYQPSSRVAMVEVYQSTGFVIWGGNAGGLKVGQQVNFWGAQWASQVTGGQWGANPSFKGFADTVETSGIQQCQPGATTSSLSSSCWTAKPGNSSPPATLARTIGVIVATAIDKSGSTIFGNIACGALVQVIANPAYGPDPGHPGFGTITAVTGDCAGVFPKPAVLAASQQQTSPVLPGQQASVSYTIANNGGTDATNAVLTENFDQLAPSAASANIGMVAAGQSASGSFPITIPAISGRQSNESSTDYESRLASADGKLFTSEGEIAFTDPFAQLYSPADISSFSQLNLPRLEVGVNGANCIAPGAQVSYPVRVENVGSATAQKITAALTLPDNTTASLNVPDLVAGTSFAGTVSWQAPGITAKGASESTQSYLARLAAADGTTLPPAVISASWQDAISNNYGPVTQPFTSLTQRVPIVSTTVPATQSLLPKQKTQFNFTATNTGTGNAVQVTLALKRQDGTLVTIPNFSLPGGQSGSVTANYSAPAILAKGSTESDSAYLARLATTNGTTLNLDAILSWTDSAQNNYGPTDNSFTANEVLPILTATAPAATTALPGQTVPLAFSISNSGSADALQATLAQQSAVQALGTIPSGHSQTSTANYPVPVITAKGSGENDAAYLARLQTFDNQVVPVAAAFTWSDAAANTYGPVTATTQITEHLPIVGISLGAAASVHSGTTISYAITLNNSGHAAATISGLSITLPDGSVQHPTLALSTLAPGASTVASVSFAIPAAQSTGVISATASVSWSDAANNAYGPVSATASTDVTQMFATQAPVANAGPAQTITLPAAATLNGTATENGVAINTVQWSKVAGPGTVSFTSANSLSTQASFSVAGMYVLRLTATATPFVGTDDITITVNPEPDNSFMVSAGPNQTVTFPGTVTLNGSATSSNGSVTVSWSQVIGPGTATFAMPTSAVTTATFSGPGTYVLRLTAADALTSASSDVTVFAGKLACTRSNTGTDFWLVLADNLGDVVPGEEISLNISGDTATSGTVSIPSLGFTQSFTTVAGQTSTVTIPTTVVMRNSDVVQSKGIHVTSQAPVSVYVLDFVPAASDGYMALPTTSLGTEYLTIGVKNSMTFIGGADVSAIGSEFAVVATQDGTTVTISAAQRTGNRAPRTPYQVVLNQGQTYQLENDDTANSAGLIDGDLTGSIITSDKPVAVVSGHRCAFVPARIPFCNLLEEEIPPTDAWGTNFVTMPLATRKTGGDLFRIVASQDQTQITINDMVVGTLNRGDFLEQSIDGPGTIAADKPILVAQMSKGGSFDAISIPGTPFFSKVFGDPFMALVPPYDQFGGSYTVNTPVTHFGTNYLNVVAPTAGLDSAIQLDGTALPAASFVPIGKSALSGAQIPVNPGSHHLASTTVPFGLTAYGFDTFDGYGFQGGACYATAAIGTQVTLTPKSQSPQLDTQSCVTVTTTDAGGQPLGGTGVDLAVTGVNPQKTHVTTDASGTASFCYTGTQSGSDLATATVGNASDTASVNWTADTTNHPPLVNAGKDVTISLPQSTATLQGSVVDNNTLPSGAVVSTHWSEVSGPAPVSFSSPNSLATQVQLSPQVTGTYTFQLAADDTLFVGTALVHVTVLPQDQPPVVSAGAAQTLYMQQDIFPLTTTLQGSASGNGTLTFQWSQFSGEAPVTFSAPTSLATQVTLPLPGVYALALTATDGILSTTAFVQITVLLNHPPVVTVGPTQRLFSSGPVTATISGTVSDDGLPLGNTLTFGWVQSQFQAQFQGSVIVNPSQLTTQVQLPGPGFYSFFLTGSDGVLTTTGFVTIIVTSGPPPALPTASLASPAEEDDIRKPVPVVGSVTVGAGGSWVLDYRLNDDDGAAATPFTTLATGTTDMSNATLATFDPSRLLNGIYTLRLTASNSLGQSQTASVNVTVSRNRKLGFFTVSFNDLSVPLPGFPARIVRTYDSRDPRRRDFGFAWSLSLANIRVQKSRNFASFWEETVDLSSLLPQYCVVSDNHKFVTITFPDGKMYKFEAGLSPNCQLAGPIESPAVSFTQVPGEAGTEGATLATADNALVLIDGEIPGTFNLVQGDGSLYNPTLFKLTTAEGFTYILDQFAGLQSVTDLNGNTLTVTPNGLIHSSGKSLVFQRDEQGRIASITDPQGKQLFYGYNPQTGDLQSFTDQAGQTTFYGYDAGGSLPPHTLTSITDPRGVMVLQNAFSFSTGQLIETVDAQREIVGFSYQPASNQETITDRNGNPTTYTYDDDGNVVAVLDALGHSTSMTYDALGNKLTETRTNDAGRTLTTTFTYDTRSNMLSQSDPLGNVTTYTYNDRRQVKSITDPRGKITSNVYDGKGNLLSTTDPLGNVTSYTYNTQGQPLTVTVSVGDPSAGASGQATTSFAYDGTGNVVQQTDALKNITSFTYDANGNKLTQTVTRTKADGTTETLTTQYQYDSNNRLVRTTNPDGTFTQTAYDSVGRQTSTTDANGNVTQYTYDALVGRLIMISYPDGTQDTFRYDAEGHRTQVSSHGLPGRSGILTNYTYDALGRLVQTQYADGGTVRTQYDALGEVASTTDALGNVTSYGYDDAGRRATVKDALGNVTSFSYDAAGNQIAVTDALKHPVQSVYDDAGRKIQTIFPDQSTEQIQYDGLGRQIAKTDQAGKVTQYGYDALGRLISVTQSPDGGVTQLVTSFGYDELGNRIAQTDANGHTTKFAYDQLGRRIRRTLPLGMAESYSYDANGNLKARTDFNSHTTTYAYDTMNRLLSKTADAFFSTGSCAGGACGATKISYTYTATGKRATMSDATGTTTYSYDPVDRPLAKSTPFGEVDSFWDRGGNQVSLRALPPRGFGASMTYGYDVLNRLATVQDATGTTTYSYDAVGNLSGIKYPNGVQTSYQYDPLNRLTSMQSACAPSAPGCGTAGTTIASYAYTLGPAGNRLSVTELSGRTVQYGYDDLYRLTSETISNATTQNGTIAYQYDAVGNRLKLSSTVPAIPTGLLNVACPERSRRNANDRLTTDSYDANGNTVNNGGIADVYDFENHLVQHGAVTIAYDGDGNRVAETVAGVTTNYLVADNNPTGYAQVLDEVQQQNGVQVSVRSYSWGLELINQRNPNTSGTVAFYGYDGHGSVRFLMSSTGAITDHYDYDAFGNLLSSTGSTVNNYLFAGEQFDPALGIYYNRARYYDERSGRFWTMDPAFPRVRKPSSLHRYMYVSQNPINKIDRTGLEEDDIASTAEAVAEDEELTALQLVKVQDLLESIEAPEVVAEAPQAFGFFAKAIAFLLIGTVALGTYSAATGGGGQVPIDQAQAEANSNNYDIYRFGNATRTALLRSGVDYELNSQGKIDPQNPLSNSYKGASAYRDPYLPEVRALGLSGVLWRVGLQTVLIADGLSVIADGEDTKPGSQLPSGHHTIFPTVQMTADDFDQRVANLGWIRVPGRIK